jgi:hypothetical protein
MFNDRDLTILGAGAVGAVLCLMLPWSFSVKVVAAVAILVLAMTLAFTRMGADRLTLEQYLKRQLAFRFQPRKYSYFQREKFPPTNSSAPTRAAVKPPAHGPSFAPLSLNLDDKGLYWLMSVWLFVIGAYVLYWAQFLGGLEQAAFWVSPLLK